MLIVSTYNERGNIVALVDRVRAAAGSEPILFVDDNSPDGTAEEVRRIQRHDAGVHLMVRPAKGGYASACREAMTKIIAEGREPHVIQFDADLSHPPEALPRMLELLARHPVVIGSRYVRGGGTQNWGFARRLLSRAGNLYARLLTAIQSEGYAFLMELKYALHRLGTRMYEFPITFSERRAGRSKFSGRILLEGVWCPVRLLRRRMTGDGLSPAR